jgi:hypothetical protein
MAVGVPDGRSAQKLRDEIGLACRAAEKWGISAGVADDGQWRDTQRTGVSQVFPDWIGIGRIPEHLGGQNGQRGIQREAETGECGLQCLGKYLFIILTSSSALRWL